MASCDFSDFRVLIVPGLHDSGPDHWQTRWQQLYPMFERVEQMQWDLPDLNAWSERLDQTLRSSTRPTLLVAHSFGCLTTVSTTSRQAHSVVGALLVAPADPHRFNIGAQLHDVVLPYPSIMIGSTNDPWMDAEHAIYWARLWKCEFVDAGALGHINAESELQDWQFGLFQLRRLIFTCKNHIFLKESIHCKKHIAKSFR
jgi:predicted alpha/beta hydrolase family esterase